MKILTAAALLLLLAWPARAAYEEEGLSEEDEVTSTDTVTGADEEEQPMIQESDEDLSDFVTDYVKKDIQLKGSFLIEERPSGKMLKLELVSVDSKASEGEGGAKKVKVTFKDPAGKKVPVFFYLQSGPWGGLDIFRIELKGSASIAPARQAAIVPAKAETAKKK